MGEEAFDEVIIPCEDGMVLHVTGGYGREEVCLGSMRAHGTLAMAAITAPLRSPSLTSCAEISWLP